MSSKVVMFHNVGDSSCAIGPYLTNMVTYDQFEATIRELLWGDFSQKKSTEMNYLTFDDGYKSVLIKVLPLLEKFNVPAIVFVTTGYVSGDLFPYELDLANMVNSINGLNLPNNNSVGKITNCTGSELYQKIREKLRLWSPEDQRAFVDNLAKLNDFSFQRHQHDEFLSWDDVVTLDQHPLITIGSHTHSHPVLSAMNPFFTFYEMIRSKKLLQKKLGHHVSCFAYPYGAYNRKTMNLARLARYNYAFTTEKRCVDSWKVLDLMAIPRFDAHDFSVS